MVGQKDASSGVELLTSLKNKAEVTIYENQITRMI